MSRLDIAILILALPGAHALAQDAPTPDETPPAETADDQADAGPMSLVTAAPQLYK